MYLCALVLTRTNMLVEVEKVQITGQWCSNIHDNGECLSHRIRPMYKRGFCRTWSILVIRREETAMVIVICAWCWRALRARAKQLGMHRSCLDSEVPCL